MEATQFLTSDEIALLARCGVSVTSTGLVFESDLDEGRIRTVWAAVSAIRRRSSNADWTNWLVGDWGNEAARRLGEGADWQIIREEEAEYHYTQHLWRLAGAVLQSLQLTELTVGFCCRYLAPDRLEITPGTVYDVNKEVRRKTLGQLNLLLKERRVFIEAFEERMDTFVEHRNRFAHRLWVDGNEKGPQEHVQHMDMLKGREQFMLDLLVESDSIGKIFKGLFSAIGVTIADQEKVATMGDQWTEWAVNLSDFDQVRRKQEAGTS